MDVDKNSAAFSMERGNNRRPGSDGTLLAEEDWDEAPSKTVSYPCEQYRDVEQTSDNSISINRKSCPGHAATSTYTSKTWGGGRGAGLTLLRIRVAQFLKCKEIELFSRVVC